MKLSQSMFFGLALTVWILTGCSEATSKRLGKDGVKWTVISWSCGTSSLSGAWPEGSVVEVDFTNNSASMGVSATLGTCIEKVNHTSVFDDSASTVSTTKTGNTCSSPCRSPLSLSCTSASITGAETTLYTVAFNPTNESLVTMTATSKCDNSGSAKTEALELKKN